MVRRHLLVEEARRALDLAAGAEDVHEDLERLVARAVGPVGALPAAGDHQPRAQRRRVVVEPRELVDRVPEVVPRPRDDLVAQAGGLPRRQVARPVGADRRAPELAVEVALLRDTLILC